MHNFFEICSTIITKPYLVHILRLVFLVLAQMSKYRHADQNNCGNITSKTTLNSVYFFLIGEFVL